MLSQRYSVRLSSIVIDEYFKAAALPSIHRVLFQFGVYTLVIPFGCTQPEKAILISSKTPVYEILASDIESNFNRTLSQFDLQEL